MDLQISIPDDLKQKVEEEAKARGMSLPDFVRTTLAWAISQKRTDDSLFSDTAVYVDDGPADFASNHDEYLYGDGA